MSAPPVAVAPARYVESGSAPVAWKSVIGIKPGDRPLVVWIAGPAADATVERRTLDEESVRLASRAFRTVRITATAARTDPFLARYASLAPALVVFSPDLALATTTYGPSLDARTAFDAMRVSARTYLGTDLDVAVARARALTSEERYVVGLRDSLDRSTPTDTVRRAELDRRLAAIRAESATVLRPPSRRGH